jgi:hypothetical protein
MAAMATRSSNSILVSVYEACYLSVAALLQLLHAGVANIEIVELTLSERMAQEARGGVLLHRGLVSRFRRPEATSI